MNIVVLGSTSFGNSTVIWDNEGAVMIDCGFSQKYTVAKLADIGLDINSLSGVLITHSHTDHIKETMVGRLQKEEVSIHCHDELKNYLEAQGSVFRDIESFDSSDFELGGFTVRGFKVPHDSKGGCYGYNIFKDGKKITVATDLGNVDSYLINNFLDSDVIVIESNYDPEMLEYSSRPWFLKNRITKAHLSNDETAGFIKDVLTASDKLPRAIFAAHISQQCNTNEIVEEGLRKVLKDPKFTGISLEMTHRTEASNKITL